MTSSDVVCIVRGIFSKAAGERCKAGHTGTLDPLASGVLPVALGKATRLFDYLLTKKKSYTARFRFGSSTDTLDAGGKITESGKRVPTVDEIAAVLPLFVGETEQIPPAYSAKSVDGKRAYDLARQGKTVILAPKKVTIESIEACVSERSDEFVFRITCGAGTYIRALARDIAGALGTTAYMTSLVRESSGLFDLSSAVTLDCLGENPLSKVLPVDFPLAGNPRITLDDETAARAANGIAVAFRDVAHDSDDVTANLIGRRDIAVYSESGLFIGMGELDDATLKMRAVLC